MKAINTFFVLLVALSLSLSFDSTFSQTDFWQPTNGPYGGEVTTLVADSMGQVFVGTLVGGVFRSNDDAYWKQSGLTKTVVLSLIISPNAYVFAATADLIFGGSERRTYRSSDYGNNWTLLSSDRALFFHAVNRAGHLFASNSNVLFGGSGSGVLRSTDNGESWQAVNSGLTNLSVYAIVIDDSGHLWAGTLGGLFLSMNNGDSWVLAGLLNTPVASLAVGNSGQLFVGTNLGVFRYTISSGALERVGLNNATVISLLSSRSGEIYASTTNSGVYRSPDNGNTWIPSNAGLGITVVTAFTNANDGNVLAGTLGKGVFRFDALNATWTQLALVNTSVYSLTINSEGNLFAGTRNLVSAFSAGSGVFRSSDEGMNWTLVGLQGSSINALKSSSTGYVFAGTGTGAYRSGNNGDTWISINRGLPRTSVSSFALHSNRYILAGTFESGIFRSENNGEDWTSANNGLPDSLDVIVLAVNHSGEAFAGTYTGVFRSTNDGDNWRQMNNGLPNAGIFSLAIDDRGFIFAGSDSDGVFISKDNGENWAQTGLTNTSVFSLAVNSSGHIYAATYNGVFQSKNEGASWTPLHSGLSDTFVFSFTLDDKGHLFAGTLGNGVFRTVESTTTVKDIAEEAPSSLVLAQNYPNPFNPSTTIEYNLPSAGDVSLRIYDLFGHEVATLVNEKHAPGIYKITWDAGGFASGIYFYRLKAGKTVQTRKLILVR